MNWKKRLQEIEKDFGFHKHMDWKPVIKRAEELLKKFPNDVELTIYTIYLLHNILVEEEYPDEEQNQMIKLLMEVFNQSKDKFSENPEYLFFVGKILHIAEWYFDLEDNKLAIEFQKKAWDKEPHNLLYEWAYRMSCPGDNVEGYLAHQIIKYEKGKINWLKSKGFPGNYILDHLISSNNKYLEKKASPSTRSSKEE